MKIVPIQVSLIDKMGSDLSVVNAARVSFAKESDWAWDDVHPQDNYTNQVVKQLSAADQKLISYLAKHQHWSPFAHTSLQFRIKAPIFVARQLVKHQVGGVWNEVSRRYVSDEPEFYFPEKFHLAPENAKQGASDTEWKVDEHLHEVGFFDPKTVVSVALRGYEYYIKLGMAPEEARMFLPLNTMTEWWWTGSLMFFARVCKQRLDSHAQGATREVAQQIQNLIPEEFKHSWEALCAARA